MLSLCFRIKINLIHFEFIVSTLKLNLCVIKIYTMYFVLNDLVVLILRDKNIQSQEVCFSGHIKVPKEKIISIKYNLKTKIVSLIK